MTRQMRQLNFIWLETDIIYCDPPSPKHGTISQGVMDGSLISTSAWFWKYQSGHLKMQPVAKTVGSQLYSQYLIYFLGHITYLNCPSKT